MHLWRAGCSLPHPTFVSKSDQCVDLLTPRGSDSLSIWLQAYKDLCRGSRKINLRKCSAHRSVTVALDLVLESRGKCAWVAWCGHGASAPWTLQGRNVQHKLYKRQLRCIVMTKLCQHWGNIWSYTFALLSWHHLDYSNHMSFFAIYTVFVMTKWYSVLLCNILLVLKLT